MPLKLIDSAVYVEKKIIDHSNSVSSPWRKFSIRIWVQTPEMMCSKSKSTAGKKKEKSVHKTAIDREMHTGRKGKHTDFYTNCIYERTYLRTKPIVETAELLKFFS